MQTNTAKCNMPANIHHLMAVAELKTNKMKAWCSCHNTDDVKSDTCLAVSIPGQTLSIGKCDSNNTKSTVCCLSYLSILWPRHMSVDPCPGWHLSEGSSSCTDRNPAICTLGEETHLLYTVQSDRFTRTAAYCFVSYLNCSKKNYIQKYVIIFATLSPLCRLTDFLLKSQILYKKIGWWIFHWH